LKMNVITVENLHKGYGDVKAVDGISFEVHEGEIFGFLGPNGAGKTTTIEIIEGYRVPDSGQVTVLGLDPRQDRYEVKERIGIMLQETSLYPDLKVSELLRLFASYYRQPVEPDALLEMIGLEEKKGYVHAKKETVGVRSLSRHRNCGKIRQRGRRMDADGVQELCLSSQKMGSHGRPSPGCGDRDRFSGGRICQRDARCQSGGSGSV
jgi:ABC-type Fe3+/spermidine/putrescine transport system ATPase subunit